MAQSTEVKGDYLIPITDTNPDWKQTCEIPVIHTELKTGTSTLTSLRFAIIPGKISGLDIPAGGENLEIAGARIIAQMINWLEIPEELRGPGSNLLLKRIKEYFICNDSNVPHVL